MSTTNTLMRYLIAREIRKGKSYEELMSKLEAAGFSPEHARTFIAQAERKALGLALDPLAEDLADDGLGASERDIVKDAQREKLADKRPDPLLRESAAILGDAIEILGQDRKLSAQVLPDSPGPGRWAE